MKSYESLLDALDDLKANGYVEDFALEPVCLYCGGLDLRFSPEEFNIDRVFRFEEDSDPADNAVLFAITSTTGVKGTLVDAYGAYAENLSFDMANKLKTPVSYN